MSGGADAQRRFEMENNVQNVDADSIYNFDPDAQKKLREQKPWTKEWGCPLSAPLQHFHFLGTSLLLLFNVPLSFSHSSSLPLCTPHSKAQRVAVLVRLSPLQSSLPSQHTLHSLQSSPHTVTVTKVHSLGLPPPLGRARPPHCSPSTSPRSAASAHATFRSPTYFKKVKVSALALLKMVTPPFPTHFSLSSLSSASSISVLCPLHSSLSHLPASLPSPPHSPSTESTSTSLYRSPPPRLPSHTPLPPFTTKCAHLSPPTPRLTKGPVVQAMHARSGGNLEVMGILQGTQKAPLPSPAACAPPCCAAFHHPASSNKRVVDSLLARTRQQASSRTTRLS